MELRNIELAQVKKIEGDYLGETPEIEGDEIFNIISMLKAMDQPIDLKLFGQYFEAAQKVVPNTIKFVEFMIEHEDVSVEIQQEVPKMPEQQEVKETRVEPQAQIRAIDWKEILTFAKKGLSDQQYQEQLDRAVAGTHYNPIKKTEFAFIALRLGEMLKAEKQKPSQTRAASTRRGREVPVPKRQAQVTDVFEVAKRTGNFGIDLRENSNGVSAFAHNGSPNVLKTFEGKILDVIPEVCLWLRGETEAELVHVTLYMNNKISAKLKSRSFTVVGHKVVYGFTSQLSVDGKPALHISNENYKDPVLFEDITAKVGIVGKSGL